MGYLCLFGAIAMEVGATTLLKISEGFSKLMPTLSCIVLYVISFYLLSICLKTVNLNIAYATWGGIGIIGTTLVSVLAFHGEIGVIEIAGTIFIIAGVVLINFFGNAH